jgi:hypothetical protein
MKRWLVAFGALAVIPREPAIASSCSEVEVNARPASSLAAASLELSALTAMKQAPIGPPGPPIRVLLRGRIDPVIQKKAQHFLDLPMGAERKVEIDGTRYVFCVEPHFRKPGSKTEGPVGWHKGVTVYEIRQF